MGFPSETRKNIFIFAFRSSSVCFRICTYEQYFFDVVKSKLKQKISTRVNQKKIKSLSKSNKSRDRTLYYSNETISQQEFDYGFFTKLPRIMVGSDFWPSSCKLKKSMLPPLTK